MIDSVYYKNYKGPKLVKCELTLNKTQLKDDFDFFYGPNHDWNGMIYTYKDIFSSEHKGEQFYMEFQSDTGKHWFYGIVGEPEQYFYPPMMR